MRGIFGLEYPCQVIIGSEGAMAYTGDRRSGKDRRQRNDGPPAGVEERRQIKDRRQTFVDEVDLTDTDWESLFNVARTIFEPVD